MSFAHFSRRGTIASALGFITAFVLSSSAYAQTLQQRHLLEARRAAEQSLQSIAGGDFKKSTLQALEGAIEQAVELYREAGDGSSADELKKEWNNVTLGIFDGVSVQDLGDFRPLSQWIDNKYNALVKRFGEGRLKQYGLYDLWVLNYAIPIVFQPRGDKRTQAKWSQQEYKLHFVPFSEVVSYWVTYGACTLLFAKSGAAASGEPGPAFKVRNPKKLCRNAAKIVKFGVGEYLAPALSDRLYAQALKNMISAEGAATRLPWTDKQYLNRVEYRFW